MGWPQRRYSPPDDASWLPVVLVVVVVVVGRGCRLVDTRGGDEYSSICFSFLVAVSVLGSSVSMNFSTATALPTVEQAVVALFIIVTQRQRLRNYWNRIFRTVLTIAKYGWRTNNEKSRTLLFCTYVWTLNDESSLDSSSQQSNEKSSLIIIIQDLIHPIDHGRQPAQRPTERDVYVIPHCILSSSSSSRQVGASCWHSICQEMIPPVCMPLLLLLLLRFYLSRNLFLPLSYYVYSWSLSLSLSQSMRNGDDSSL